MNSLTTADKTQLFNTLNYNVDRDANEITYDGAYQVATIINTRYHTKWVPTDKPLAYRLLMQPLYNTRWTPAAQVLPKLLLSIDPQISQESMKRIVTYLGSDSHYDAELQHQLFKQQITMNLNYVLYNTTDQLREDKIQAIVNAFCDYCDIHWDANAKPQITIQFPDSLYTRDGNMGIYRTLKAINLEYSVTLHRFIINCLENTIDHKMSVNQLNN